MQHIRNFSIIAHIDHGKSTLADRFLESTGTIEKRKMREQVLDSMELERERGITIKMQPVRMLWNPQQGSTLLDPARSNLANSTYELNLIDTPGHIDFSYEVSRALTAVEGTILLVDATQGVQAQTLTTLRSARELGLVIIPAISKIDSPLADIKGVKTQVGALLEIPESDILLCSGRTGEGVEELLHAVIERVPPPTTVLSAEPQALIFDFQYSDHQGVIVYLRMFGGSIKKGDTLEFAASGRRFSALEVGTFSPKPTPAPELGLGSIGYIVTGIKEPGVARVGDTIRRRGSSTLPLSGYAEPKPVVWASVYPESQDDFTALKQSLSRLRLSDSSLSFEEEASGMLGRGFRCGLLGMLHLEIITERLKREFNLSLVVTTPTITYEVETSTGQRRTVYSPSAFPPYNEIVHVWEPFVSAEIILPAHLLGSVTPLLFEHEATAQSTDVFSEGRMMIRVMMPLRELMRNFFDKMKSVSQGYASISYELRELRPADVARLDILVADGMVPAFSRIVAKHRVDEEAIAAVEKLYGILPRQMFATKIQGVALGRIISSRTLPAMSKNVTQHMYGGDRTRKMKLWKKQKEGKAKMKERGRVNIPEDVFLKMVKSE
ncbi:MAG: GTP-binding protein LepA [Parcubacteria group bacterium Gr01-1014_56]|nr:MAG: GTP-binding protein LepA [Parcubacteria group bacterium Gr01-1014_56]